MFGTISSAWTFPFNVKSACRRGMFGLKEGATPLVLYFQMPNEAHSYEIRPESIKTFIEDSSIRLPRFQRKQTWDDKKDFALAISVFKGFPLGVVVINKETQNRRSIKWLLDGRQRRHALTNLLQDPEVVYTWARRFIGFKASAEAADIEELYWGKIEDYLGADDAETRDRESNGSEGQVLQVSETAEPGDDSPQTDYRTGQKTAEIGSRYRDLDQLLSLILLVHKKTKRRSGFTRPFDFCSFIPDIEFADVVDGFTVLNARKLRVWMLSYRNQCQVQGLDYLNCGVFLDYLKTKHRVSDERALQKVERDWNRIKERFEALEIIENKLQDTKLGLIELSGANASDAQTTFKIINSSGTPLSAVEVLSAKPSWNETILNPSAELHDATKALYGAIAVVQDGVVKWDAPATLVARLRDIGFVLGSFDYSESKQLAKSITLGFKIVSAIYEKGISKEHIDSLSNNPSIRWQVDVDALARAINEMGRVLVGDSFFAYFTSWKVSLLDLTSEAVAIDFTVRSYMDWLRCGRPVGAGAATKRFIKNARILFDALLFEYVMRQWRGSSDARVADHIRDVSTQPDIAIPRLAADWVKLINELVDSHSIGQIRLKTNSIDSLLKPLLHYFYVLIQQRGPDGIGVSVDVDHIIPQAELAATTYPHRELHAHNLFNLALLPSKENITKGGKLLNQIHHEWLRDQVALYSRIPVSEFGRFSSVAAMSELKEFRRAQLLEAFGVKREALFVG